jgi:sugar phosphate permease
LSVGGICSALTVAVPSLMMDRWSIRRVALPSLVFYATAMCLLGLSPRSLVIFTLLFALTEAAGAIQAPIGYAKAISALFDR